MVNIFSPTGYIFLATVLATFFFTFLARRHSKLKSAEGLSSENLNKWLVGLSAGATANSGFIVTAAVGLGYAYGMQWLILPLAWLLGDIVFWRFMPHKINAFGRRAKANTITDLITEGTTGRTNIILTLIVGMTVLVCLMGYTSAQWLAGQKFISGAFSLGPLLSLSLFAIVIILYTAIGGFRGSIYADSFQAIFRVIGTVLALGAVIFVAMKQPDIFTANIESAGDGFLNLFAMGGFSTLVGATIGFAAAAFGFGLGQPQIITRYMAGKSPSETQSAWWIYMGFVQFTWIAMTLFGVVLRGVMPGIEDPETGLSLFFVNNFGAVVTGIIVADIFATIAATSNSLLIAMAESFKRDLFAPAFPQSEKYPLAVFTLLLGIGSMFLATVIGGSVLSLALGSVSIMAAGLAPAVLIRVMGWRFSASSLIATIIMGILAAIIWKHFGLSSFMNEAAPGIAMGLFTNYLFSLRAQE